MNSKFVKNSTSKMNIVPMNDCSENCVSMIKQEEAIDDPDTDKVSHLLLFKCLFSML